MTEPVPGQTPEPPAADGKADAAQPDTTPDIATPDTATPDSPTAGTTADTTAEVPAAEVPAAGEPGPAAANPQELFGSLSLSAIEADIDRLMSDKMSQLDGMLAGLEDLVQRLEGEITNLETPPDEPHAPRG